MRLSFDDGSVSDRTQVRVNRISLGALFYALGPEANEGSFRRPSYERMLDLSAEAWEDPCAYLDSFVHRKIH